MAVLLLARHGETEWSATGRHTSRTDLPLTERGRERARRLSSVLDPGSFGLVLASPLRRAVETCELAGLGHRMQARAELREWDYGDYEGLTTPEIHERHRNWSLWRDGCPNGETATEVGVRVDSVIAEARSSVGDAIAFAHGHSLRVLAARWLGLAPENGALFALDTGALCTLGYEHDSPAVLRWNQAPP
jgi:broad specificity phosphatase PhoE